jgi:hypothetical protein
MLTERDKRFLRTVTGEDDKPSAPSPIHARNATKTMCWRVWWLNGSSGTPNRAALILFMPDVLPTRTTAGSR